MKTMDKVEREMKGPSYMENVMVMETMKASDMSLVPESYHGRTWDDEELLEAFQLAQAQIHNHNYRLASSILVFCHRLLKERCE
jgi:hypothetical protein